MNYAELARRLENLCRLGTVETIDYENQRITVKIGDIVTDAIRWTTMRSGQDKTWDAPSLGEEVAVIAPCGELKLAFAIFGFYNDDHIPPSKDKNKTVRVFSDGCLLSYDVNQHHLDIVLPSRGTAKIYADVEIYGKLHVTKDITTDADVKAGNISLKTHKTSGVKGGTDNSGGPIP